jgi:uncharacterized membrane protein
MLLGPVHLVVLGLDNDKMRGQIITELHNASQRDLIRVLDALAIQKTDTGSIISLGASDLTREQRMAFGAIVGGLLGFGATGTEEGAEAAAEAGAVTFAERNFGLSDADIKAIAADLPTGKTALLVLFEHRWAIPLKEAAESAGGVVLAQGIVRPEALVAYGAQLAAASTAAEQVPAPQTAGSPSAPMS